MDDEEKVSRQRSKNGGRALRCILVEEAAALPALALALLESKANASCTAFAAHRRSSARIPEIVREAARVSPVALAVLEGVAGSARAARRREVGIGILHHGVAEAARLASVAMSLLEGKAGCRGSLLAARGRVSRRDAADVMRVSALVAVLALAALESVANSGSAGRRGSSRLGAI